MKNINLYKRFLVVLHVITFTVISNMFIIYADEVGSLDNSLNSTGEVVKSEESESISNEISIPLPVNSKDLAQDVTKDSNQNDNNNNTSEQSKEPEKNENNTSDENKEPEKKENESESVSVIEDVPTDLDLGDYQTKMQIGDKQLLYVTVLPVGVKQAKIQFASSNEAVATVNAMGRISAIAPGTTNISVVCQSVVKDFQLKVISPEVVTVTDIDLGSYKKDMIIGEQQVLNATPLPLKVGGAEIKYKSSDEDVATINAMGRVIAKKEGKSEIIINCEGIEKSFWLKVSEEENIKVKDIDLGVYQKVMTIGDQQILGATVIPTNATKQEMKYSSSNEGIAKINALGRIFAVGEGKCDINATCGGKKKSFQLEVKEKIVVTDIEIGEFEDELAVDKRLTLKVKAIPEEAEEKKITFESSDENIAKVSSDGEILGIAKGKVKITIKSGDIKKNINLIIKVATDKIQVNSTYLILKKGEIFQLDTSVVPEEAEQQVTYRSANPNIAFVTGRGKIEAKEFGDTSIIVSNGDLSKVVTVIINEEGGKINSNPNFVAQLEKKEERNLSTMERSILERMDYHSAVSISKTECNLISKPILKKLLETQSTLTVEDTKYQIIINGKDIVNYENELKTEIILNYEDNRKAFIVNEGYKLPGKITINFNEEPFDYKYLYLFNEYKEKFQILASNNTISKTISIDETGKYLLTTEKIDKLSDHIKIMYASGGFSSMGIIFYCALKKRYWFW